jgi:hypothetical protein
MFSKNLQLAMPAGYGHIRYAAGANVNWDAIGASAELLGAIATVSTLAYLALQIRQNTKMGKVATATARAEQRVQQSAFISQSSEINRLFWAGLDDPESLSGDEYRHFESVFSTYFLAFEGGFNFNRENVLTESEWAGHTTAMSSLLSKPGFRRFWVKWRDQYPTDFSAYIDSLFSEMDSSATSPAASSSGRTSLNGRTHR